MNMSSRKFANLDQLTSKSPNVLLKMGHLMFKSFWILHHRSDGKNWKSIIGEMKKFIDSLMTHKDSRIAIDRFGTHVGRLTKLKTGIQGSFLDKYTAFKDMGTTHLGEALQSSFEKFNETVVKSPNPHAKRFLFVITDGKANGPLDVAEEAAKWKGIVDHIYALGFGTADKEGLAKITDEDANIIIHPKLDDLFKDIKEHITPKVCKSGQ